MRLFLTILFALAATGLRLPQAAAFPPLPGPPRPVISSAATDAPSSGEIEEEGKESPARKLVAPARVLFSHFLLSAATGIPRAATAHYLKRHTGERPADRCLSFPRPARAPPED